MGSGLSTNHATVIEAVVQEQQSKPIDISDITDLETAKKELERLRMACNLINIDDMKSNFISDSVREDMEKHKIESVSCSQGVLANEERGLLIVSLVRDKIDQRHESLSSAFLSIDTDKSGFISKDEFKKACWNWGIHLEDSDFAAMDSTYIHQEKTEDEDKGINYNEFINLLTKCMNYRGEEGEGNDQDLSVVIRNRIMDGADTMKQAFKEVDRDSSGFVDKREMGLLLQSLQVSYSEADFEAFYARFDKNGDGRFSYGEFVQLMQSKQ